MVDSVAREHEQDVGRELDGPPKPKRVKVQTPRPKLCSGFSCGALICWSTTAGRRRGAYGQLHLGSQRFSVASTGVRFISES